MKRRFRVIQGTLEDTPVLESEIQKVDDVSEQPEVDPVVEELGGIVESITSSEVVPIASRVWADKKRIRSYVKNTSFVVDQNDFGSKTIATEDDEKQVALGIFGLAEIRRVFEDAFPDDEVGVETIRFWVLFELALQATYTRVLEDRDFLKRLNVIRDSTRMKSLNVGRMKPRFPDYEKRLKDDLVTNINAQRFASRLAIDRLFETTDNPVLRAKGDNSGEKLIQSFAHNFRLAYDEAEDDAMHAHLMFGNRAPVDHFPERQFALAHPMSRKRVELVAMPHIGRKQGSVVIGFVNAGEL